MLQSKIYDQTVEWYSTKIYGLTNDKLTENSNIFVKYDKLLGFFQFFNIFVATFFSRATRFLSLVLAFSIIIMIEIINFVRKEKKFHDSNEEVEIDVIK